MPVILQNMRGALGAGVAVAIGAIGGGLCGGLLAAYWWDFPADDFARWHTATVALYAFLGAVGGSIVGGFVFAAFSAVLQIRDQRRSRRSRDA